MFAFEEDEFCIAAKLIETSNNNTNSIQLIKLQNETYSVKSATVSYELENVCLGSYLQSRSENLDECQTQCSIVIQYLRMGTIFLSPKGRSKN